MYGIYSSSAFFCAFGGVHTVRDRHPPENSFCPLRAFCKVCCPNCSLNAFHIKERISQLDEKAVERVAAQKDAVIERQETQIDCLRGQLANVKHSQATLTAKFNDLLRSWNTVWQEPEMTDAWKQVEMRKEQEAKEKARQEAEAKRESEARQSRYMGVLDKFISEGHETLSSFARTGRVNFDDKEAASIFYGIMATAAKNIIDLDSRKGIEAATDKFLSGMSWRGFTDFKQECVCNWTKLFASNEVQFTDNAIDNFLAFVDHMSCCADTYVSLGGSNGSADQLTNWDGTQKVDLGEPAKRKGRKA